MSDLVKTKIQDESGQVVVEYTMLIAVIVTLIITVFGIIKERFVADDNCSAQTLNPVCAISGAYSDPTFRRFPIRR
jgi:Flp pilus assembly pilin Flp